MKYLFALLCFLSFKSFASHVLPPDTANSDYLKGQARLKRENMESLLKKSQELITLYDGYKDRAKVCQGAKPQWQKAMLLAKQAHKKCVKAIKLTEKAEKAKKMNQAKKYLCRVDGYQLSAREDCTVSEERKKEIDFELKGCN